MKNQLDSVSAGALLHFEPEIPGTSKEHFDTSPCRKPHINLNYYASSNYPDSNKVNPLLFTHYLAYLNFEREAKQSETKIFLQPEQMMFIALAESIDLIMQGFCKSGQDTICIMSPSLPSYAHLAKNNNIQVIDVPLVGENFERLQLNKILEFQSKVIFLAAPNTTVGSMPSREQILSLIKESSGLVVLDESYIEFADNSSFIDLVNQYPNILILRSFSKIWGMPGLRSGVTIGHPKLINTLKQMRPHPFPTHTQQYVLQMLQKPELVFRIRERIKTEREFLIEQLKEMEMVLKIYPSETNFVLAEFKDAVKLFETLTKSGILIRKIDPLISHALKIPLGTREDQLEIIKMIHTHYIVEGTSRISFSD